MLNRDVFSFLNQLIENNNRDWFKVNKSTHDECRNNVIEFSEQLYNLLKKNNQLDNYKVFRIYRDVRFSKNKTPYKNHFGVAFHRTKPLYRGGYYIHFEPKNSFIACGFWKPEKNDLFRIRKEIEADYDCFKSVVNHPLLIKKWGSLKGDKLKTAPKGFERNHPGIDLLRFKQFIYMKRIKDDFFFNEEFIQWVEQQFEAVKPMVNYMGDILTTNLNGESVL